MSKPQPAPGIKKTCGSDTQWNGISLKILLELYTVKSAKTLTCSNPQESLLILVYGVGKIITETFREAEIYKLVRLCGSIYGNQNKKDQTG